MVSRGASETSVQHLLFVLEVLGLAGQLVYLKKYILSSAITPLFFDT